MLTRLTVVSISQCIQISNHVVHLRLRYCYMAITLQKRVKNKTQFSYHFKKTSKILMAFCCCWRVHYVTDIMPLTLCHMNRTTFHAGNL